MHYLRFQCGMNARAAVFASILSIRIFDTLRKLFIFLLPFAFASCTPIVIAIFGDLQDLAHTQNRKLMAMLADKLKFHG
jgi:hypothetical protein